MSDNILSQVKRSGGVVTKKIGSVWMILETNHRYMRTLNTTAGYIWNECKNWISIKELSARFSANFNIPNKKALKDVSKFVEEYLKAHLLISKK